VPTHAASKRLLSAASPTSSSVGNRTVRSTFDVPLIVTPRFVMSRPTANDREKSKYSKQAHRGSFEKKNLRQLQPKVLRSRPVRAREIAQLHPEPRSDHRCEVSPFLLIELGRGAEAAEMRFQVGHRAKVPALSKALPIGRPGRYTTVRGYRYVGQGRHDVLDFHRKARIVAIWTLILGILLVMGQHLLSQMVVPLARMPPAYLVPMGHAVGDKEHFDQRVVLLLSEIDLHAFAPPSWLRVVPALA
jgi:hypothetical protein